MREILFRGKRVDNGEWVYGDLVNDWSKHNTKSAKVICNNYGKFAVIPETVGQFTGLTDFKNGKKIFEGDIVWGKDITGCWHKGIVKYDDEFGSYVIDAKLFMDNPKNSEYDCLFGRWTIEGNIHDNPELVRRADDE